MNMTRVQSASLALILYPLFSMSPTVWMACYTVSSISLRFRSKDLPCSCSTLLMYTKQLRLLPIMTLKKGRMRYTLYIKLRGVQIHPLCSTCKQYQLRCCVCKSILFQN